MSLIKFNKKELVTIWKALKYRNEYFNCLGEDQFYEQGCEKESKDIDKLLKKVEERICTQIAK